MFELYKLSFYLMLLIIDRTFILIFYAIYLLCLWPFLLITFPFLNKDETRKKLLFAIKSLDK